MANRTVSVELQAKVAPFVEGLGAAEGAASDLNDELTALGKHDKEFRDLEEKAAGLTAATKLAASAVDDLGDEVQDTGAKAHFLAMELAKARREAEELAVVLRAGGGDADMLKRYQASTRRVTRLESSAKRLGLEGGGDDGGGLFKKAGADAGKEFSSGFGDGLMGAGGLAPVAGAALLWFAPITVPLAIAAGLELGAALGGAISVGIGTVGIAGGVAAAFRDPRVKQVATRELGGALAGVGDEIGAIFAEPTIAGLRIVRDEINKLRPELAGVAQQLAPSVTLLAEGLAGGMDNFAQHLEKALINSQPLIEWLAHELPEVFDELGGLLENITEHADEERFALNALFAQIEIGIKVTEAFIDVASALIWPFVKLKGAIDEVRGTDLQHHLDAMGTGFGEVSKSAEDLLKEQQALKSALDRTTAAFERQLNQMLASDNAAIEYQQNIDDLTDSVKKNGRSLDTNTQKGRDNRRALDQLVGSLQATYEANIAAGMSADKAGLAFLQQEGALKRQMEALGLSKDVINSYISRLDAMRYAAIAANNAIRDTGTGFTHHDSYAQGGYRHAAAGMYIPPSDPGTTLVGEPSTGGEWLIPQAGISMGRAVSLLEGAARPWGLELARSRPAFGNWGGSATSSVSNNSTVNYIVNPVRSNIGVEDLRQLTRVEEIRQRVGRPR